jgi:PAS domain S-box-containing protein
MPAHGLRRQLPVWIAAVLTATVVAVGWATYFELHRSILASVDSRLAAAATEIGSLLQTQTAKARQDVAELAREPALNTVLASETPQTTAAAENVLRTARAKAPTIGALALWTADGHLVASDGPQTLVAATRPKDPSPSDSGSLGRFVPADSGFAYTILAPIRIRGQAVGYLVRAQHSTAGGGGSTSTITKLVGKDARLLIGNTDDDVWTDLGKLVDPPPAAPKGGPIEFRNKEGKSVVGRATAVPGTPWAIWIELPEASSSLASVHALRSRGLVVFVVLTLLGALASWVVVRRVSRDIASQELADRAALLESKNRELRQSELRFRQLVDHSPDAIIVHRGSRIIFANAVAARVLGLASSEEALNRSILEFVPADEAEQAMGVLGVGGNQETPSGVAHTRLVRPDKSEVLVEATAMGVDFDGEPATQTIIRDVTERQMLEDQLRQSQKMDAVGRLAGGVAHDFNNLLTIIHAYADMAVKETPASDPRRADLEEVLHAAKSAAALTRQMLAFSRKQVLEPQRLDLNRSTTGIIGMIRRVIGENIEVKTTLREGIHPIWADAGQVEQVLMNLAVNARDAMPEGGMLDFETANVHLESGYASYHGQAIPAGDYVMLSVADTGVGMTEEIQKKIFEPFFTTKEPGKGTGLGLATVYGIIKQSDGFIWVYSEPGQGTVFKIYFPRHTGQEEPAVLPVPDRPLRHDRMATILLVEDEPHVRGAVKRILESRRFTVLEADRPSAAHKVFAEKSASIDLVLTDMMMPERTGAELIRELTALRPDLRAIIMSGYSEEATSRQWRLPANALFVEKPIEPSELFRKMNEAFGWRD